MYTKGVFPVFATVLRASASVDKESYSTKKHNLSIIGGVCCSNDNCPKTRVYLLTAIHELKVGQLLLVLHLSLSMQFFGTAEQEPQPWQKPEEP